MSTVRRSLTVGAVGAVVLGLSAAPALAEDTATVSVLHAVPGVPVDVYANGEELIPDFQPGTLTDPLQLPAGTYDLAIYPAGSDPATTQPAASADDVAVPAGANATIAAHLTEAGTPVLTPYVNDVSAVPAGQARVTVRHTAAAPAVDVRAGGAVLVPGLVNPAEASLVTDAGTVSADVVLAGTTTVAIGPADLTLAEGTSTIVYAWGSADAGYQLAVQTIDGLHSSPSGVPGGTAGLTDSGLPLPVVGAGLLGLVVVGLGHAACPPSAADPGDVVRPARLLVVLGVLLAVGVPTGWLLTRPGTSDGPPVAEVLAEQDTPGRRRHPLLRRPGVLPEATARPATPAPATPVVAPVRLEVPALGLDAPVDAVGVEPDGLMTIPEDVDRVGWYRFGPAPGAPAGSAVLAGHVDDAEQGLGVLAPLSSASVGDEVLVTGADGTQSRWQVVAREEFDKEVVPLADLFDRQGPPRLVLITCGGPFLGDIGSYRDNVVVVAEPVPAG